MRGKVERQITMLRVAHEFLGAVVAEARRRKLLSEDHFTVGCNGGRRNRDSCHL